MKLLILLAALSGVVFSQIGPPSGPPSSGPGSGTVTSIATGCGLAGGPVTASGTISGTGPCWAAGGGTAQAQTATYSPAATLTDGFEVCWKPTAANSGAAPTFSPNGLTAHVIVKQSGAALVANDIITTAQACAIYDSTGTQWELQNPQTTPSGSAAVVNTTPVTVSANSTGAQVLQQLTIPAGVLNVAAASGGVYTYNGSGIYTAAALQTPTLTWTLNHCTVSGCGSGTVRALATIVTPSVVTATNNTWNIRLSIANTATGTTGTLIAHGSAVVELTGASDLGTTSSDSNTTSSGTIDLTGITYLQLTVTTSTGNAGNSITEDHSSLEPASAQGPPGPTGPTGSVSSVTGSSGAASSGGATPNITVTANVRARAIGNTFYDGGAALASGVTNYLRVPFACALTDWSILVDTGTATIKTWKIATGTAIPTVTNSISTSGVAISSGTATPAGQSMADFTTTAVTKDDIFGFNLFAVSSATQVNFILECDQ